MIKVNMTDIKLNKKFDLLESSGFIDDEGNFYLLSSDREEMNGYIICFPNGGQHAEIIYTITNFSKALTIEEFEYDENITITQIFVNPDDFIIDISKRE